jgi:hypothetical protein
MKVAFYTMGDHRQVPGISAGRLRLEKSEGFRRYAEAIGSNHILGVRTDAEAIAALRQLQGSGVRADHVIFVGHGRAGEYHFSRPEGMADADAEAGDESDAYGNQIFRANDVALIGQINAILRDDVAGVTVEFHSCYTGRGGLLPAIQAELTRLRTAGRTVNITGYEHFFDFRPEVDRQGQIVGWHNVILATRDHRGAPISGGRGTLTPTPEIMYVAARVPRR